MYILYIQIKNFFQEFILFRKNNNIKEKICADGFRKVVKGFIDRSRIVR